MHTLVPLLVAGGIFVALVGGLAYGFYRLDRFCKRYGQKASTEIAVLKFQREHAYRELAGALEEADVDEAELESLAYRIGRSFLLGLLGS